MSHLSYFGGGPATKIQKNNLIIESSEDIAKEILNDIVTLLLENLLPEDNQDTLLKNSRNEVASDFVIDNNFESLRKKVFVKERLQPIARPVPAVTTTSQKIVKNTTFKNTKFVNNKPPASDVISAEPVLNKPKVVQSNLSAFLDSASSAQDGEFLLSAPPNEQDACKCPVYLLGGPKFL